MSKPFSDDEIISEQQFVDDAKRFSKMFGSLIKVGDMLAPIVSVKRAANEANVRLQELREEEIKTKAALDLLKASLESARDEIARATNDKLEEIAKATSDKQKVLDDINREIATRKEELDTMLKKREEFLKSIGAK